MARLNKQSIENLKASELVIITEIIHRGESYCNVCCRNGDREAYLYSAEDMMLYPSIDSAMEAVKRHVTDKCETIRVQGYVDLAEGE